MKVLSAPVFLLVQSAEDISPLAIQDPGTGNKAILLFTTRQAARLFQAQRREKELHPGMLKEFDTLFNFFNTLAYLVGHLKFAELGIDWIVLDHPGLPTMDVIHLKIAELLVIGPAATLGLQEETVNGPPSP